MAGEGIKVTAALREKFNAYVGADVLTKEDDESVLVDRIPTAADAVDILAPTRLAKQGDGIVGIRYERGRSHALEKLITTHGEVRGLFCPMFESVDGTGIVCTQTFEARAILKRGNTVVTVPPQTMTLAIIGLFGRQAVPANILKSIDDIAIRGAETYFSTFTQPPPAPVSYDDGPSGHDGDCR